MGAGLGAVTTGKVVDDRTVMHIVGGSIPLQSVYCLSHNLLQKQHENSALLRGSEHSSGSLE